MLLLEDAPISYAVCKDPEGGRNLEYLGKRKRKKKKKLCALMTILKGITVIKYDCEEIIVGGPFMYIFGHIIV